MSSEPRVLILGAGVFQLALIRAARDIGAHVVTLDNVPTNPGHALSHASVNCSTTDVEGVLHEARQLGVDAVVSMASDIAVPTVAYVTEALGRPGPSPQVAGILTSKHRFREFQVEAGLRGPPAVEVGDTEPSDLPRVLDAFPDEVIVKPSDTSGSRGIARVNRHDGSRLHETIANARAFSRTGSVCVEGYVDGVDVSVEGFVLGGTIVAAVVTQKFQEGYSVIGHRLAGNLTDSARAGAVDEVDRHLRALGYADGPFDADLRVYESGVVLLEMTPRLGGNGVPLIASRHTGTDLVRATLDHALGLTPTITDPPTALGCGSVILRSRVAGTVRTVATAAEVMTDEPAVWELECTAAPGVTVDAFTHGGTILGYALVDCSDEADYLRAAHSVQDALCLEVAAP